MRYAQQAVDGSLFDMVTMTQTYSRRVVTRRHRARWFLRIACPAALAAVLITIWLLTVQTPAETTSLSDVWARAISQISGLSFATSAWVARKVVHTFEFFPVGFFLALTVEAWAGVPASDGAVRGRHGAEVHFRRKHPSRANAQGRYRTQLLIAVIALCFLCSLGDQVHKIFVPGREFDALDMCFDAAGYLLGVWIAAGIGRWLRGHQTR